MPPAIIIGARKAPRNPWQPGGTTTKRNERKGGAPVPRLAADELKIRASLWESSQWAGKTFTCYSLLFVFVVVVVVEHRFNHLSIAKALGGCGGERHPIQPGSMYHLERAQSRAIVLSLSLSLSTVY